MKKIIILLLLIISFTAANACDCDHDKIVGLKEAKNVFRGTVLSVTRIDTSFVRYEVVFAVKKNIKGEIKTKRITVNVPCLLAACCGIEFRNGEDYIIYTYINDSMLYTNACTSSHKL